MYNYYPKISLSCHQGVGSILVKMVLIFPVSREAQGNLDILTCEEIDTHNVSETGLVSQAHFLFLLDQSQKPIFHPLT